MSRTNLRAYRRLLAEQLGLKDMGPNDMTLCSDLRRSETLPVITFVAAVVGASGLCRSRRRRRDAAMIGTFIGVGGAVAIAPYPRISLHHGTHAVPGVLRVPRRHHPRSVGSIRTHQSTAVGEIGRWPVLVAELAVVGFMLGGWHDTKTPTTTARDGSAHNPAHKRRSLRDVGKRYVAKLVAIHVMVFNRARTTGLYTDRFAVQGGGLDFMMAVATST